MMLDVDGNERDQVQSRVSLEPRPAPVTFRSALALILGTVLLVGSMAAAQGRPQKSAAKDDAAALYKAKCAVCHGAAGNSPLPEMNFADGKWQHGSSPKEVARVIRDGVPRTAMLGFGKQLSEAEIEALAAHVRTFDKTLAASK
jgi:mono/diheme cytochrome c family protein